MIRNAIAVLLAVLVLCPTPAVAQTDAELLEVLKQLKSQVQSLQQQVDTLQQELDGAKQKQDAVQQVQQEQEKDITTVKKNVGRVYKKTVDVEKSVLDKVKIGAWLDTTRYWFNSDFREQSIESESEANTVRLDLNLDAYLTEELKFTSVLTMYKLWGLNDDGDLAGIDDVQVSNFPESAGVEVRHAYVDYRPKWLDQRVNIEAGRLPTDFGASQHLRYGLPKLGTYPDLAFNATSDGVATTFYLHEWLPIPDPRLTFIWAKAYTNSDSNPWTEDLFDQEDTNFYIGHFDTGIPGLDGGSFILNFTYADAIPPLQGEEVGLTTVSLPGDIGDIYKITAHFMWEDIYDLGLDFFASYAHSWADPSGEPALYSIQTPVGPVTFPALGLQSDTNDEETDGWAVYTGLRYRLPFESVYAPSLGFEYNHGSRFWSGLNFGTREPRGKLNVRGDAYEVYLLQPAVEDYLTFRIGWQHIDRKYSNLAGPSTLLESFYGEPEDSDIVEDIIYIGMQLYF
jgi:hypothetical protein